MNTKQSKIKDGKKTQPKPKVGPWSGVSAVQAKTVREAVREIMGLAVWGKGSTDTNSDDLAAVELIKAFASIARAADTCLRILSITRSQNHTKAGPYGHISLMEAKQIRSTLAEVQGTATNGLRCAKRKALHLSDIFPCFSVLKKYGYELEAWLCP